MYYIVMRSFYYFFYRETVTRWSRGKRRRQLLLLLFKRAPFSSGDRTPPARGLSEPFTPRRAPPAAAAAAVEPRGRMKRSRAPAVLQAVKRVSASRTCT